MTSDRITKEEEKILKKPVSPFPARRRCPPSTLRSYLWSGVTGLFDVRWLLGMRPAIVDRPAPKGATVTILIPAHNEEGHLIHAVDSLFKQTYPIFSVIIAENGSRDATGDEAEWLARKYPDIVFALRAGNVGSKAAALNAGLDAGFPIGELIVEMDADTEFAPDAIERLIPHFNDPTVAVVCGQVLPKPYSGKRPSVWWRAKLVEYILGQGLTKEAQNSLGAVMVMCGCFSMFYASLIGKFSDATMAEDMEKSWELQFQGYKAVYEPESLCYASEPETKEVFWNQRWRWLCGFLQCYELYVGKLFRRNTRLFFVVHYMFICALTGMALDLFLFPIGIYYFTRNPALTETIPIAAITTDIGAMLFALICYSYNIGGVRLVLTSLRCVPAAFWGTFVIQCCFFKAILWEWILQIRLKKWKSGHGALHASSRTATTRLPA